MKPEISGSCVVEAASMAHGSAWKAMRMALWPDDSEARHQDDIRANLRNLGHQVAFLGFTPEGECVAFAEASIRRDFVNGCETSPVVFLEGIFVEEAYRRRGFARALCVAVEQWGISKGCSEFASDAHLDNVVSHQMHEGLEFVETERVVYFRKGLGLAH